MASVWLLSCISLFLRHLRNQHWSSVAMLWPLTTLDTVRDLGVALDAQLSMKSYRWCCSQLFLPDLTAALNSPIFVNWCFAHSCLCLHRKSHRLRQRCPVRGHRHCHSPTTGSAYMAVLHAAVRLITGVRRNDHITPILRDTLHWLSMSQRIVFKIALFYDCIRVPSPA